MDPTSTRTTPLATSTADLSTGTDAPSSPKRPRLDLPSADLNSASNTLNGAVRRPKAASIFTKDADKQPEELRGPEEQFVDQQLEVQDGADYYETLLTVQTAMNRLHHPTRHQIRMLLSLSLFPLLFKPPTKSSNHSFSRRGAPIASSSSDNPIASTLLPQTDEPLSKSHRKLREQARGLWRDVMVASGGAEVVCRAVRGSGRVETERERKDRVEREEREEGKRRAEEQRLKAKKEDEDEEASVTAKGKKVVRVAGSSRKNGPSSSNRRTTSGLETDDDEDLTPLESDDVLAVSAKRIGQVEDLWEFLAGTTARKVRVRTRERPVIDDNGGGGGWELVKVLVEGWEEEHKRKEKERVEEDPPAPLSLLRYFKPSASSGFAREVSNKALDVVFWPFSDAAHPKKEENESENEDEEMSEEGEKEKKGADKAEGEMGLQERRAVTAKLLGLIGYSAIDGYLSGAALLSEVVQRMKTLQPVDFAAFVETLSVASLPPAFLPRLLTSYLETHSHPLSSIADLLPTPPPSSTLAASSTTSSGPTSPRKRGLGSTTSLSSVDLGGSSSAPNASQHKQRPEATFWQTPSPSSADFLPLLARIPIEVPLDPPTTSLPNSASSTKRPKLLLPKTFARAQAAVEAFGVVKAALVSVVAGEGEVGEEKREEWMDVMERVKEKVEEARRRVEQQGQGMGR